MQDFAPPPVPRAHRSEKPPLYRKKKAAIQTNQDRIEKMKKLYGIRKNESPKNQPLVLPNSVKEPNVRNNNVKGNKEVVSILPPIQQKKSEASKFNSEYTVKIHEEEKKAEEIEEIRAPDIKSVDENEVDNLLQWVQELPEELSSTQTKNSNKNKKHH